MVKNSSDDIYIYKIFFTYIFQRFLLFHEDSLNYEVDVFIETVIDNKSDLIIEYDVNDINNETLFIWAHQLITNKYKERELIKTYLNKPVEEFLNIFNGSLIKITNKNIDWINDLDSADFNKIISDAYGDLIELFTLYISNFENEKEDEYSNSFRKGYAPGWEDEWEWDPSEFNDFKDAILSIDARYTSLNLYLDDLDSNDDILGE